MNTVPYAAVFGLHEWDQRLAKIDRTFDQRRLGGEGALHLTTALATVAFMAKLDETAVVAHTTAEKQQEWRPLPDAYRGRVVISRLLAFPDKPPGPQPNCAGLEDVILFHGPPFPDSLAVGLGQKAAGGITLIPWRYREVFPKKERLPIDALQALFGTAASS